MNLEINSALASLSGASITENFTFLGAKGIIPLLMLIAVIFVVELAFFFIPGVSVSSLVIALACLYYPFWIVFTIAIIPIYAAHFILLKNPGIMVADFLILFPMILFGAIAGPIVLKTFGGILGWSIYGATFSLVKWGVAIPVGMMTGGSMGKRFRELVLEPLVSSLLFQLKGFFFFLFPMIAIKLAAVGVAA